MHLCFSMETASALQVFRPSNGHHLSPDGFWDFGFSLRSTHILFAYLCLFPGKTDARESWMFHREHPPALFSSISLQRSPPAAGRPVASRVRADCLWEATATERSACPWASAAPSWIPRVAWWAATSMSTPWRWSVSTKDLTFHDSLAVCVCVSASG